VCWAHGAATPGNRSAKMAVSPWIAAPPPTNSHPQRHDLPVRGHVSQRAPVLAVTGVRRPVTTRHGADASPAASMINPLSVVTTVLSMQKCGWLAQPLASSGSGVTGQSPLPGNGPTSVPKSSMTPQPVLGARAGIQVPDVPVLLAPRLSIDLEVWWRSSLASAWPPRAAGTAPRRQVRHPRPLNARG
jgi:hypothetical protein